MMMMMMMIIIIIIMAQKGKRIYNLLAIREIQVKTITRYHIIPTWMVKTKRQQITSAGRMWRN